MFQTHQPPPTSSVWASYRAIIGLRQFYRAYISAIYQPYHRLISLMHRLLEASAFLGQLMSTFFWKQSCPGLAPHRNHEDMWVAAIAVVLVLLSVGVVRLDLFLCYEHGNDTHICTAGNCHTTDSEKWMLLFIVWNWGEKFGCNSSMHTHA